MVRHGGSSAGSYLADPTSPIPSHCASIVVTSTVRVKIVQGIDNFMNSLPGIHWALELFEYDYSVVAGEPSFNSYSASCNN